MLRHPARTLLAFVCLALASGNLSADPARVSDDVAALAARIDELIAAGYKAHKVEPAPLADDAEFLRRVYLDLAGRIPRVAEVRLFLDDRAPDKRRRLVETACSPGPIYVNHFTNVWRRPAAAAEQQPAGPVPRPAARSLGAAAGCARTCPTTRWSANC